MEEKERSASAPIIPNLQLEQFFPSVEKNDFTQPSEISILSYPNFYYLSLSDQLLITSIFQPPRDPPLFSV